MNPLVQYYLRQEGQGDAVTMGLAPSKASHPS
jgi:hypothetical protein